MRYFTKNSSIPNTTLPKIKIGFTAGLTGAAAQNFKSIPRVIKPPKPTANLLRSTLNV